MRAARAPEGGGAGDRIGKAGGSGGNGHGHVSAVTGAPSYRRMGLASALMDELEGISENNHDAYFVDLIVRESNTNAIEMYERLGYVIYRTVLDYYSGEEHAHDMRKPLRRDEAKRSIEGRGPSIRPQQLGPDFGGS